MSIFRVVFRGEFTISWIVNKKVVMIDRLRGRMHDDNQRTLFVLPSNSIIVTPFTMGEQTTGEQTAPNKTPSPQEFQFGDY